MMKTFHNRSRRVLRAAAFVTFLCFIVLALLRPLPIAHNRELTPGIRYERVRNGFSRTGFGYAVEEQVR